MPADPEYVALLEQKCIHHEDRANVAETVLDLVERDRHRLIRNARWLAFTALAGWGLWAVVMIAVLA